MAYATRSSYFSWPEQVPISFTEWKTLLSKLTKEEINKRLSSTSDPHRLTTARQYSPTTKRTDQSLSRNQVFNDTIVDSFLVSSSNNAQSSTNICQHERQRLIPSPNKRYVSSFKTLVNSTSGKHSQRVNYVNDSVIILKLSKENETENTGDNLQLSDKNSSSLMATSMGHITPSRKTPFLAPSRLRSVLKQEAQKRRIANNDSASNASINNHLNLASNSTHSMATSASSHSPSNPSLFTYRNSIVGGNTIRQRAFAETPTNNILITTERLKPNISSSMRPTRQPLATAAPNTSATYLSSQSTSPQQQQQQQRNTSQNAKSRSQQDKPTNFKDLYEYPDPFTNCPQEFLSKLAQLTKLQLETIDWEKKRRFTKKKTISNGLMQGKDSP
ncbi:unnamed protein product [Rotaria socialis]|uniref:Uncharacterized protein n=1 Tax=Rotaria socialis TaxID=392032 RepID=A0A817P638_9BILA|nr:unnamed protein product [Rotaria socialis]CAF3287145.1 unnamed protein product [Rotaria socialis]CAF3464101.1 unnamed protein product [Rotaria socialis]CAF3782088.1 unnamed protein product [Rotaria socialis]CAF4146592.1 unnamed protein product [Rotaria socialis]